MKRCSRCRGGLYASHGNQLDCGTCRLKRSARGGRYTTATFGRRSCAYCRRPYETRAENQRFCSQRCKDRAKPAAVKAKYARPSHGPGRRAWAHAVASGLVRCARGHACKWAEWVDGELVGGFIRGPIDLGRPDGESSGGPEHRECNRAAPIRLRAAR
jgi:hypothetical protein